MSYRVIIIDDEPWTRDVIKSLGQWDMLGLEVVGEASDGEYGLALIGQLKPEIILTDVRMPHLNGIDLLERLRNEGNPAKVIIISGYDDFSYTRSAFKLNANDYLLKPVKPEELNEQLRRCVEELNAQHQSDTPGELDLEGFMNVEWVNDYFALRNKAGECLYADDAETLRGLFKQMHSLITEREGAAIPEKLIICIYYDLLSGLQRFIISSGYRIDDIYAGRETSFVFSRGCTLDQILDHALKLYTAASNAVSSLIKTRGRVDVRKIESYIAENYLSGLTLEQTAERFYVSKEYLSKIFRSTAGESFSDYITSLKMDKAKELIRRRVPLKEIGLMVGYTDQAHFYKAFKKYFGVTPGEMQRDINNVQ